MFKKDSTYLLNIRYLKHTDHQLFRGFDYNYKGNERIVAIQSLIYTNKTCKELTNDTINVTLPLHVKQNDFNTFKFWQGKDSAGENKFLITKIPVTP